MLYNILNFLQTAANEDPGSEASKRKILVSRFIVANFANACKINGKIVLGIFKMHMKDAAPYLSRENPMSIVCNERIGNEDPTESKILDFNQDPNTGEKIVPGIDLKVKVPGSRTDPGAKDLIDGWDSELYKILTRGWPKELDNIKAGLSNKPKKLPETRKKGPKVKTSFVEPVMVKRKVVEKPDLQAENIELRIQQYRCTTCALLTQRQKRHKGPGACFEDNPNPIKNKIRNQLKSLCAEAKMKRLAEEAEIAKMESKNDSESDSVEDEEANVEKLMESFNESVKKEDLDEQCSIAGDIHFEVKKVAEKVMEIMKIDKFGEPEPETDSVITDSDANDESESLERIGEDIEKSLENIEKSLENLSEIVGNAVYEGSSPK